MSSTSKFEVAAIAPELLKLGLTELLLCETRTRVPNLTSITLRI
jgi:hypothetical protein